MNDNNLCASVIVALKRRGPLGRTALVHAIVGVTAGKHEQLQAVGAIRRCTADNLIFMDGGGRYRLRPGAEDALIEAQVDDLDTLDDEEEEDVDDTDRALDEADDQDEEAPAPDLSELLRAGGSEGHEGLDDELDVSDEPPPKIAYPKPQKREATGRLCGTCAHCPGPQARRWKCQKTGRMASKFAEPCEEYEAAPALVDADNPFGLAADEDDEPPTESSGSGSGLTGPGLAVGIVPWRSADQAEAAPTAVVGSVRCPRCGWTWSGPPEERPEVCPACMDDGGVETHFGLTAWRTVDDVAQAAIERAETTPAPPAQEEDMEQDLIKQHDELRSKAGRRVVELDELIAEHTKERDSLCERFGFGDGKQNTEPAPAVKKPAAKKATPKNGSKPKRKPAAQQTKKAAPKKASVDKIAPWAREILKAMPKGPADLVTMSERSGKSVASCGVAGSMLVRAGLLKRVGKGVYEAV